MLKRLAVLVLCLLLLVGCTDQDASLAPVLELRQKLLEGKGCNFSATVTADYGEYLHTFVLQCNADGSGDVSFQVIAPDSISGITGSITQEEGKLTFDNEVLIFSPLADGLLAPVTAPWVLIHTLRSGYIVSCGETEQGAIVSIDDSYAENSMGLEIRLDHQNMPVSAEIIWQGRRILSMIIDNFVIL